MEFGNKGYVCIVGCFDVVKLLLGVCRIDVVYYWIECWIEIIWFFFIVFDCYLVFWFFKVGMCLSKVWVVDNEGLDNIILIGYLDGIYLFL